jgi:carbon-monoxide dehydrogenase large subunit
VGDINLPRQTWAVVVRSPHAHAAILGMDTTEARAMPGVLGVYTAADLGDDLGTTTVAFKRQRPDGSPMFWRAYPGLARDEVHHVGDPVAFVVAETLDQARDAAEAVRVDYDARAGVGDIEHALAPGAPAAWLECPDNISHVHAMGDQAATDAAFAGAAHVVRRRYRVSRVHAQYMEPRAAIGSYDPIDGRFTLHCDAQQPHRVRDILAREVFRIPSGRIRVVGNDIGGGFGGKGPQMLEFRLILWASRRLERPVKWQCERSESLLFDEHGRDNLHEAEIALDANGRFLALRSHWIANLGAYVSSDRNFQASFQNTPGIVGVYDFPTAHVRFTCVLTNTPSFAPYRGAGRPEASYVIERLIDDVASELGMDRIELRRRNVIAPQDMPRQTPLGYNYDCGEFERCMDMALERADWNGFAARRQASAARGRLRGIGLSNPIERAASPGMEYAEIRFDARGRATALMGSKNHGQGHETAFKQILGTHLGLAMSDIDYVDGDTDRVAFGVGTFGSRSAATAGTALVIAAGKIVEKGRRIAAHLLEAAGADVSFEAGVYRIAGTDRTVTLKEVAAVAFQPERLPPGTEPGLFENGMFAPDDNTYPYGTHVVEVEIDPDTGDLAIVRYVVADDVGTMINPLLVKGQIHGGIGQGGGQVLKERVVYDPATAQLLTASFMDYAMPRAEDFCEIEIEALSTPTGRNLLGVKGAGEAGAVGAVPALMNAIIDALSPLGVREFEMPATPERVWRAIEAARTRRAA